MDDRNWKKPLRLQRRTPQKIHHPWWVGEEPRLISFHSSYFGERYVWWETMLCGRDGEKPGNCDYKMAAGWVIHSSSSFASQNENKTLLWRGKVWISSLDRSSYLAAMTAHNLEGSQHPSLMRELDELTSYVALDQRGKKFARNGGRSAVETVVAAQGTKLPKL